jgi:hypothetical protein
MGPDNAAFVFALGRVHLGRVVFHGTGQPPLLSASTGFAASATEALSS